MLFLRLVGWEILVLLATDPPSLKLPSSSHTDLSRDYAGPPPKECEDRQDGETSFTEFFRVAGCVFRMPLFEVCWS